MLIKICHPVTVYVVCGFNKTAINKKIRIICKLINTLCAYETVYRTAIAITYEIYNLK